jgi:integrase
VPYSELGPTYGLTAPFIASLTPRESTFEIRDTRSSLALRVHPSGKKRLRYHNRSTGVVATMPWAPTRTPGHVTLEQGRAWALRLDSAREVGIDELQNVVNELRSALSPPPPHQRVTRPGVRTVEAVFNEWFEKRIEPNYQHPLAERAKIANYILPATEDPADSTGPRLGDIDISQVTVSHCAWPIELALYRGHDSQAAHVFKTVSQGFSYAARRGYTRVNVAADMDMLDFGLDEQPRDRALSKMEIPLFWNRIAHAPLAKTMAFRIILLTGVRISQFLNALRINIDLRRRIWAIPFEDRKISLRRRRSMKTKRPFLIPFPRLVGDMFEQLMELGGESPYLVPSSRIPGAPLSKAALGREMARHFGERKRLPPLCPLPGGPLVTHDLRRTLRSHLISTEVRAPLYVAERCLDHSMGRLIATYEVPVDPDHMDYIEDRREALEKFAALVTRLVDAAPVAMPVLADG